MFFLCQTRILMYLFLGMLWRLGLMHRRGSDWHILGVQYTLDIYLNSVDIYWFKELCWVLVSHWVDKPQVWCSTEYSQPLPSLLSSSLHFTEHVGRCWPQASSDESWVRSGQPIFFFFSHIFAMGLVSKVNIWTHSIKWSPGKKKKKTHNKYLQLCSGFFIETDESMMHEKAVRLAEGGWMLG